MTMLECSDPPLDVVDVTCLGPNQGFLPVNCEYMVDVSLASSKAFNLYTGSSFPVTFNTESFPVGENTIQVIGYIEDTREEVFLGKASVVIPGVYAVSTAAVCTFISFNNTAEIGLHFTNNTPQVNVDVIYAVFETNRHDLDIECHVKGLDRRDCKCIIFSSSGFMS